MTNDVKVRVNHNNLADLGLYEAAAPKRTHASTSAKRAAREKRKISSTDGRVLRRMNRDRQYNTRVTEELAELVEELCDRYDLTKAELTERALRHYAEYRKSGGE